MKQIICSVLLLACKNQPTSNVSLGGECALSTECAAGQACIDSRCRPKPCTATNECGDGFVCSANMCAVSGAQGAPTALTYAVNPAVYAVGEPIADNAPAVAGGTPSAFTVQPALPSGLSLNAMTGVISGTPSAQAAKASYTVTALNADGSASTALDITVTAASAAALVAARFGSAASVPTATEAKEVPLAVGSLTLEYSGPLSTGASPAVTLSNAQGSQALVSTATGNAVSITLPASLQIMTRYRVSVGTMTGANGIEVPAQSLSFVTVDGSWSTDPPFRVSNLGVENVDYPRVTTTGNHAAVVWYDNQAPTAIRMARAASGTFSAPILVNELGTQYFKLQASISPVDDSVFVGHQQSNLDEMCVTHVGPTGARALQTLASANVDTNPYYDIAIDGGGSAAMAWTRAYSPGGTGYTVTASVFSTNSWGTNAVLETDSTQINDAHLAALGNGQFLSTWRLGGLGTTRFSIYSPVGGWLAPRSTTLGYGKELALTSGAQPWLLRLYSDGFGDDISASRYSTASDAWSQPIPVASYPQSDSPSIRASYIRVVALPDGEILAIWLEKVSGVPSCDLRATHYTPAGGFSPLALVAHDINCYQDNGIRTATDSEGNVSALTYSTFGGTLGVSRYQRANDTWLAQIVPGAPFVLDNPDIAARSDGSTILVGTGSSNAHVFAIELK